MQRRQLLLLAATVPLVGPGSLLAQPDKAAKGSSQAHDRRNAQRVAAVPPGECERARRPRPRSTLSKDEWRKRLSPQQYDVLREEGTERAGTSKLNAEKRRGVYACAGCGLPLFTSEMKYESGTGWPSYFTTIPGVFGTKEDRLLFAPRIEYHCVRCGGHHGHVFRDGPPPTHERWCNNGVALTFLPA